MSEGTPQLTPEGIANPREKFRDPGSEQLKDPEFIKALEELKTVYSRSLHEIREKISVMEADKEVLHSVQEFMLSKNIRLHVRIPRELEKGNPGSGQLYAGNDFELLTRQEKWHMARLSEVKKMLLGDF